MLASESSQDAVEMKGKKRDSFINYEEYTRNEENARGLVTSKTLALAHARRRNASPRRLAGALDGEEQNV